MNIKEIIANEITNSNNWDSLSKEELTLEEMETFKNKLNWEYIFTRNSNIEVIDNKLIDTLIEEKIINYDEEDYFSKKMFLQIAQKFITEIWIVKKYKDYFSMPALAYNRKFKASELVKIYGKPEVGTGVTYRIGSDCYPYTVIESDPKGLKIKIQSDTAIPLKDYKNSDTFYVDQTYKYERNPDGDIIELKLNSKGKWANGQYGKFTIGTRKKYLDPSF